MMKRYTSIDAFCGAGGLGYGLRQAGFDLLSAFDSENKAIETFQRNVSSNAFVALAEEVTGQLLLDHAGFTGRLDLLVGGPPCQGFSKQKRGAHLGDERNKLVLEYIRLVRETTPRFFLLENVDQLGQKRGREFINRIQNDLKEYNLYPHFYNSADYGVAQTRGRFIIVGQHNDVHASFTIPKAKTNKWKTVGEVFRYIPEPPEDYSEHPSYPNHYRAKVTSINIERFSYVPQGGGWQDIPEELRLECHKNVDPASGGWPDVYGRLQYDGQAPTITGGFDSFTRGRYGHPLYNRPITPREAALLQGFPTWFRFYGNRGDVRYQIGNAVPPPLAKAIGESIHKSLRIADGLEEDDFNQHSSADQIVIQKSLLLSDEVNH